MEKSQEILVLQHIDCEGLGSFEPVILSRGLKPVFINAGKGDKLPEGTKDFCALILLGGPIGVYETERYPFLEEEMRLIQEFADKGTPILGICLGAQLIAESLGGKVYKGNRKEIGWYRLYFTGEGRKEKLFKTMPDVSVVFQWHGDTFELPDGAVRLAYNHSYPNQAFKMGENIYGLQFHLEVTEDMVTEWMEEYKEEVNGNEAIRPDIIYADTKRYIPDLKRYSSDFIRGFLDLI